MKLRPSEIYFTQASISSKFGRCTRHKNKTIGDTLDDLAEGRISIGSIPNISVMKENGKWWTADNRRLWIFRHLEKLRKCTEIPVDITKNIDSRKRSSTNGGIDVYIFKGRNPGGVWHSKVESIKIQDTSEPKDINKDIFTVPVVQSHANNQIGCITDCILSDNKILECNDQHINPTEANKGSTNTTSKPDSSNFESETAKMKHNLSLEALKSDDLCMQMNYIPLEISPFSYGHHNISSTSHKTELVVSNPVNYHTALDVISKRASLHQSSRHTPYKNVSKFSRLSKTTSDTNTRNMFINSIPSYFSKIFQFANNDDRFVDTSIYQQNKYYYVHPKKNVHSYPKINDHNYDSGSDLEDECEYCDKCESDISNESQSLDESSDDSSEESSGDSDVESSEESYDDNSYDSDDEYSDLSDNESFNYSPKKNSSYTFQRESHHSSREFQHSDKESCDILYDSFHNSVDEFRCYNHLSKGFDDEDSCDSESSSLSFVGDHYTAVLDRAYLAGCYNSDVDNMIYDYVD